MEATMTRLITAEELIALIRQPFPPSRVEVFSFPALHEQRVTIGLQRTLAWEIATFVDGSQSGAGWYGLSEKVGSYSYMVAGVPATTEDLAFLLTAHRAIGFPRYRRAAYTENDFAGHLAQEYENLLREERKVGKQS